MDDKLILKNTDKISAEEIDGVLSITLNEDLSKGDCIKIDLKSDREMPVKKVEQLMLERILYIGEEVPEYFVTDKRPKFILLGNPEELLDSLKGEENK